MGDETGSTTSVSLLQRLRDNASDTATWDEFVERYGVKINRWCRTWGLQQADADDVTQNVLLSLSKQMQTFEYRADGRFRSWLKTVAYRAWCRFHEDRKRMAVAIANDAVDQLLASVEAREDFLEHLDRECERNQLEDAMQVVKGRVQLKNWNAFYQTAVDARPANEVADDLGISVVAVYQARSRIQRMVRKEVERLDGKPDQT